MQCCRRPEAAEGDEELEGNTITINVIAEPTGREHQVALVESQPVEAITQLLHEPSLAGHITVCRFAGYSMHPASTLRENGIQTGATVYMDVDHQEEERRAAEALREARCERQAAVVEMASRVQLLDHSLDLFESGIFADMNRYSDHIGGVYKIYKNGVQITFSRCMLAASLALGLLGLVGAVWMLMTGGRWGGTDCDWSTANYVGVATALIFTYGLVMMHTCGPSLVASCMDHYRGGTCWLRMMNLSIFCLILPTLQWGWVVWGQESHGCAEYMQNVKIAFYVCAMHCFFVTFITPLLRQRYIRSCEVAIVTEQEALAANLAEAPRDWQIQLLCIPSEPGHQKVQLSVEIDRSYRNEHLMRAVAPALDSHDGFAGWDPGVTVICLVCQLGTPQEPDMVGRPEVLARDACLVPRIEQMGGWVVGEEWTTARAILCHPDQSHACGIWDQNSDAWRNLMHEWLSDSQPGVEREHVGKHPDPADSQSQPRWFNQAGVPTDDTAGVELEVLPERPEDTDIPDLVDTDIPDLVEMPMQQEDNNLLASAEPGRRPEPQQDGPSTDEPNPFKDETQVLDKQDLTP